MGTEIMVPPGPRQSRCVEDCDEEEEEEEEETGAAHVTVFGVTYGASVPMKRRTSAAPPTMSRAYA